ncbi:hypothetical protein LG302_18940 [Halomonas organivorans]
MIAEDQAAGLRAWAQQEGRARPLAQDAPVAAAPAAAPITLMVVGLPSPAPRQAERVSALLEHWADQGRRWVGDPRGWKVVPLAVTSPHLGVLVEQQKRWALWVDADAEAFRRAMAVLSRLVAGGGPRRLLAVHPPDLPRQGLLENLRQAARRYLGVDLLVMA